MKIALIAPPFIAVPPRKYGGTELFLAELAAGLSSKGVELILYTNGESTLPVPIKWLYEQEQWPLNSEADATLKGMNHDAWAVRDALSWADIIHMNNAPGLALSRFVDVPMLYTVHHALDKSFAGYYCGFPDVSYATISDFQRTKLDLPRIRTIHHGIDLSKYGYQEKKENYFTFLGRIAPPKGTHLAIEIAQKTGIPLKIAGEIQPIYRDYWERMIKPEVDGRFIEYVGEVGFNEKNELLRNSKAMLFPIRWDEPFGLVMVESMACGTPVLALSGGSVREVVKDGVSGYVRDSVDELVACARNLSIPPRTVRAYVEEFFSSERMVNDYMAFYSEILAERAPDQAERVVA